MEKLTLEQIAPYPIGENGLRVLLKNDNAPRYIYCLTNYSIEAKPQKHGMKYASFYRVGTGESEFKPILSPTDLTKPIIVEGKEIIPIVELARLFHSVKEPAIVKYDNIIDAGSYGTQVSCYLDKDRHAYYSVYADVDLVMHNEARVVQWLFKHKFDVFGLIEKGLAVDVNTLETNPYN